MLIPIPDLLACVELAMESPNCGFVHVWKAVREEWPGHGIVAARSDTMYALNALGNKGNEQAAAILEEYQEYQKTFCADER